MSRFLIIPDLKNIDKHLSLAEEYDLGFEYNDFFMPDMLDDEQRLDNAISAYKSHKLPPYCTSHGDFFDVIVFSDDKLICAVADKRIRLSIDVARRAGAKAVVFHTNYEPALTAENYVENWISRNERYWSGILEEFPDVNIYLENMFDRSPDMLGRLSQRLAAYKNYGVCFDYAHACSFGRETDISRWVGSLAPYVKHLHINDNDLKNDLHLAVGDGKIDWEAFAKDHEKHFSECTVLIEVSGIDKQLRSVRYLEKTGLLRKH